MRKSEVQILISPFLTNKLNMSDKNSNNNFTIHIQVLFINEIKDFFYKKSKMFYNSSLPLSNISVSGNIYYFCSNNSD
jgi:hypothetical protein